MMQLTQVMTRSSLAAIALLNLSLATSVVAEPIVVTRGPNGAAHIVKTDNIPADAQRAPKSAVREFPQLVKKGPGGAVQIVNESKPATKAAQQASRPRLIQRGPNGAFAISSQIR